MEFTYFFENHSYPTKVEVQNQQVVVTLFEIPCEFSLIDKGTVVDSYLIGFINSTTTKLAYAQSTQTLSLRFSLATSLLTNNSLLNTVYSALQNAIRLSTLHATRVSGRLQEIVSRLQRVHTVSIYTLNHISSLLLVNTPGGAELKVFTAASVIGDRKMDVVFRTQPRLLTLDVLESDLDRFPDPELVLKAFCDSADLQLCLDQVLKELATASSEGYTPEKYRAAGFYCIPASLHEVRVYYRGQYGISLVFLGEFCEFSVVDLGRFGRIPSVPLFANCVHHIQSRLHQLFPECKAPSPADSQQVYHKFVVTRPEHVRLALKMLLSYLQNMGVLNRVLMNYAEVAKQRNVEAPSEPGLSCTFHLSKLFEQCFDAKLSLKKQAADSALYELKFDLVVTRSVPSRKTEFQNIKSIYEQYYEAVLSRTYLSSSNTLFVFISTLIYPSALSVSFHELLLLQLKDSTVEVLWSTLGIGQSKINYDVRLWKEPKQFVDLKFSFAEDTNAGQFKLDTNIKPEFLARIPQEQCSAAFIVRDLNRLSTEDLKRNLKN